MRIIGRLAGMIVAAFALALMLSACGSVPPAARMLTMQHTECPEAVYSAPLWSPDGKLIYYIVRSTPTGPSTLRVMTRSGSGDRVLAEDAGDTLSLSPDGTSILFARHNAASGDADDVVLDTRTGHVRMVIGTGEAPVWSPDSQRIAHLVFYAEGGPLYLSTVQTGKTARLTDATSTEEFSEIFPSWSPDGRRIAFASNREGSFWWTYIQDLTDGRLLRVPRSQDPECNKLPMYRMDYRAYWSPDGSKLAVEQLCSGLGVSLRFITPEGTELVNWEHAFREVEQVKWSPDSKRLLFFSQDAPGHSTPTIADMDGSHVHRFSQDVKYAEWSPDGKHILLAGDDLSIADQDGSNLRVLPVSVDSPSYSVPHWSPDAGGAGSRIVFVGFQRGLIEIFTIKPDGSDLTQLTHNPGPGSGQICLH